MQNQLYKRIQFKPYNKIFLKFIKIYRILEKIKIHSHCKSIVIAFSLLKTAVLVPSDFLHLFGSLNHSLILKHDEEVSLHVLFHSSKDHHKSNRYICCIYDFERGISTFSFSLMLYLRYLRC